MPRTARGRRTREQLLRAAERVFGDKGFERASISEITQTAGVAQGTFYVYFLDKKAIFVELVEDLGARLLACIHQAVSGKTTRVAVEEAGLRALFAFCVEHRGLYAVVRQAELVDADVFRAYYRRIARGYVKGLGAAIKAGELRRHDAETLAWSLMGMADFLGMRFVLWEQEVDVERLVQHAMKIIRFGIEVPKHS